MELLQKFIILTWLAQPSSKLYDTSLQNLFDAFFLGNSNYFQSSLLYEKCLLPLWHGKEDHRHQFLMDTF